MPTYQTRTPLARKALVVAETAMLAFAPVAVAA